MASKLKSTTSYRAIHTEGLDEEEIRKHEYLYQYSEFDENGNILLEETHLHDGIVEHKASYRYDGEGHLVEELLLEEDDFVSEHRTMEFDEKGRLWKEQMHYLDESYDEIVYQYDEEGKLLQKETTDDEGESGNRIIIEYKGKTLFQKLNMTLTEKLFRKNTLSLMKAEGLFQNRSKARMKILNLPMTMMKKVIVRLPAGTIARAI
jgi:hypothetical protein